MKKILIFVFSIFTFMNFSNVSAQENDDLLNVIAKSLPEQYIKSKANLFFTIQIGAYINKNAKLASLEHVIVVKESDNLNKYRLGEFNSYEEAKDYKNMLLSVCKDAFIVSIKNGKRIHITEALKDLPAI